MCGKNSSNKLEELVENGYRESRWQTNLLEYSLLINKLEEAISEKENEKRLLRESLLLRNKEMHNAVIDEEEREDPVTEEERELQKKNSKITDKDGKKT